MPNDNQTPAENADKSKGKEAKGEPSFRTKYVPNLTEHPSKYPAVVLGNWIGLVRNQRVSVGMYVRPEELPQDVRAALQKDGIKIGKAPPPMPKKGQATIIVSESSTNLLG